MKHLTMKRDDFIASAMLIGFGRSIYGDPGLQLELTPNRAITILHSAKDCTLFIRYGVRYQPRGAMKSSLGKPRKFHHDNQAALDWLVDYIDNYRSEHADQ